MRKYFKIGYFQVYLDLKSKLNMIVQNVYIQHIILDYHVSNSTPNCVQVTELLNISSYADTRATADQAPSDCLPGHIQVWSSASAI